MERYKESAAVKGALEGIRPATVGLIAAAVITIGEAAVMPEHSLGGNFSVLRDMTISVGGMQHRCDIDSSLWTDYTVNSKI